jgi:hypothetical protein
MRDKGRQSSGSVWSCGNAGKVADKLRVFAHLKIKHWIGDTRLEKLK